MRNKHLYLTFSICIISILYSCNNINKKEIALLQNIDTIELKKSSTINLNIDTIPYEFVSQTKIYDKNIYIACSDTNTLLKIKPNGNIERIDIPISVHNLFINENGLYLSSYLTPLMHYMKNGKRRRINLPKNDNIGGFLRTYVKDSIVYYYTFNKNKSNTISMYNMENKEMQYMGDFTSVFDSKDYRFGSSRHIVASKKHLYTIGKFVPILEKYDFNGTLIENYDLRKIPVISKWFDTESLEKRLPIFVIIDCCIDDPYLYLSARDDKMPDDCRTILKFNIKDKIMFDCQYSLHDSKQAGLFDVNGDSLIVFDQKSHSINLYNLKTSINK